MHSENSDQPPPSDQPWHSSTPANLHELFGLYCDRYKPIYSYVQVFANQIPAELAFEIQAAWDHVSRHYQGEQPLESCLDSAARHVKRAILDCYKLVVKYTLDEYEELRKVDVSLIDNGNFDRALRALVERIRTDATTARRYEGHGDWSNVFGRWDAVFENCQRLHHEFYLNKHVDWAHRKQQRQTWRQLGIAFALGVISSLAAAVAWQWCMSLIAR